MIDPIFDIFREEAREHFAALESGLLDLESAAGDERRPLIDELFRHAHSLKGDARAVDLRPLQHAAQSLEDLLEQWRAAPETVDPASLATGLQLLDQSRQLFQTWLQETVEPEVSAPPVELAPVPVPATMELQAVAAAAPVRASEDEVSGQTVRVASDQLDRILSLIGELRIHQRADSQVQQSISELRLHLERGTSETGALAETALDQLRPIELQLQRNRSRENLLADELEREIRKVRLLPLNGIVESLRRPVRDLAQSLGKQLRFEVDVGRVQLDKAVVELVRAPLLHLLRNAIDHGLETPEARAAAGKPEAGLLRISARQRAERVRIEIIDDGAGLDFTRIRSQLLRRNLVDAEKLHELTHAELAHFLFQPGFSTAEIGEISGRGVGLDSVRDACRRMNGTVEWQAQPGPGATFVLEIPVSISTMRILSIWHGGQYYGVPTANIVETGRATESHLRTIEGRRVLSKDGEAIPWLSLSELLNEPETPYPVGRPRPYLMMNRRGRRIAIAVDELEEEREILLKRLGFPAGGMPGVLGGAIRPDGSVKLVLDLSDEFIGLNTHGAVVPRRSARAPRILVVDDSSTTRTVLRNLFTSAGYAVTMAVDGVDALDKIKRQAVDLVVSDFEMPRLNGPDLARQIKHRFQTPVVLVTGRENDADRQAGLEAGADAYLLKSTFEGDALLDVVRQLI